MSGASALYRGEVVHQRFKPKRHALRYRVFSLLIDLDELPLLDRGLKLFGHNRRAVFSVHDSDHGHGKKGGLRAWVAERLAEAGLERGGAQVTMLCYPRIFGYVFNPLTVYFCRDGDGVLTAILYEVCNTFHERHTYIIPVAPDADGAIRHACAKEMYVSPFVPMDCLYRFRIQPPADGVMIAIHESDPEGPLLFASFQGRREGLTDGSLLRALFSYPLMTLKVMGAIHWEALRLWLKGVPIHRHRKAASAVASSVIAPEPGTRRADAL
ncbi:DUF1365 domain-containing protein [Rhizobium paknamense]|uniref:DUF1365 family protein n=1 Tax=Rhizobium paknamense TaxID=1206817 RepID=A0ABU0IBA3_9HYPH|nr:DUF1365 domain-containing protein [Rhizobium paknamense]MDQ0455505.1 DUF1365 family protein [Rhizobium paknamense]